MRLALLTLAALVLLVAPAGAAASKGYTAKGHHHPQAGNFRVQFSGEGTWSSAYQSTHPATDSSNGSSTTFNEQSSFKWDWEENARRETVRIPATCHGAFNECKTIVPGASLVAGRQSLSYTVADTIDSPPDPTQQANCTDSLDLAATGATDASGIGITIKHSADGSRLTFSQLSPSPLSNGPDGFLDKGSCNGLDAEQLWIPGGDGAVSTTTATSFFDFRTVAVATHLLQTANTIVLGVSGPKAGNGPQPNCGNTDPAVTCTQKGSWTGKITLTRVHH